MNSWFCLVSCFVVFCLDTSILPHIDYIRQCQAKTWESGRIGTLRRWKVYPIWLDVAKGRKVPRRLPPCMAANMEGDNDSYEMAIEFERIGLRDSSSNLSSYGIQAKSCQKPSFLKIGRRDDFLKDFWSRKNYLYFSISYDFYGPL